MSRRKAFRPYTRFIVLGVALGTLGGYGGYAMRPSSAHTPDQAEVTKALASQTSNRAAKGSRLAKLASAAEARMPTYALASVPPAGPNSYAPADRPWPPALRPTEDTVSAVPPQPNAEPALATASAGPKLDAKPELKPEPKVAALTPVPPPEAKPKRLPPPPPPSSLLDDHQIAGLRTRLRLTSDQAEYWPAVETALRDVARKQLRLQNFKHGHGKANIDVNSPEVQQLIYAAMPLLMRLREDQKHEVRKLARIMGLDQVASQI